LTALEADNDAAIAKMDKVARTSFDFAPGTDCRVINCSAQNAGGNNAITLARPSVCINKSEKIAPSGPVRLRVAPLVACVRLGSATDHDIKLIAAAIETVSSPTPNSFENQPNRRFSSADGSSRGEAACEDD
jgi:hypothetical protein